MNQSPLHFHVSSIAELHQFTGLEPPKHPLFTVIDYSAIQAKKLIQSQQVPASASFTCDFYSVNFKKHCNVVYGQQIFDHKEGTLLCTSPAQIIHYDAKIDDTASEGWGLYFHPELLRNTKLGQKIREYSFFMYEASEALHLSTQEKQTLLNIIRQMEEEYNRSVDAFSHELILSNIELLLNYCKRFYGRQFLTRTAQNKDFLSRFETFLSEYIHSGLLREKGIPSVSFCAQQMNLSPNYLSDLLRTETGKNTQEHIHFALLDKARQMLSGTDLTVSEIAFELGFEYPQYFSRLFKMKTGKTPALYRAG